MGSKLSTKKLRRLVERGDEANALLLIAEANNRNKQLNLGVVFTSHDSITLLHLAALMGMPNLVRVLLDSDAVDINRTTQSSGRSPLHFVCSPTKMLLSQFTPGERAAVARIRVDLANALSATPETTMEMALAALSAGDRALYSAAVRQDANNREVLELLLAREDINVSLATTEGVTPLHQTAYDGYLHGMERLVATGRVDASAQDARGNTPLHQAAMQGFDAGVELLLAIGRTRYLTMSPINVMIRNNKGRTPLEAAASRGKWASVRLLLEAGTAVLPHPDDPAFSALGLGFIRDTLDEVIDGDDDGLGLNDDDASSGSLSGAPPETPAGLRRLGRDWAYRVHVSGSDGGSSDSAEEAGWSRSRARMSSFPDVGTSSDAGEAASSSRVPAERQVALDTAEIGDERDDRILAVVAALDVSPGAALALLQHNTWDADATIAWYLRNPAAACDACGILNQEEVQEARALRADTTMCLICMDDIDDGMVEATDCAHVFCRACWASYLGVAIRDAAVRVVTCPGVGCAAQVADAVVERLVEPETYQRYLRFKVQAFVDEDPRTKWCPAPGCELAVEAPPTWVVDGPGTEESTDGAGPSSDSTPPSGHLRSNVRNAECGAGHTFCFACAGPAHEPAACSMLRRWDDAMSRKLKQPRSDEKTRQYLLNEGIRVCPNPACDRLLSRNGGCNHFRCGGHGGGTSGCGYEFCWVCLSPWRGHTSAICSRGKSTLAKRLREGAAEATIQRDERFEHHFTRFRTHWLSEEVETKLRAATEEVIAMVHDVMPDRVSMHFLRLACQALIQARATLKYAYVRAYFMQDGLELRTHEHAVATLERYVESLSAVLALPYQTELNVSHRGNIALLRFAMFIWLSRSRVWRLTTLVDSCRRNLLEVAHGGHTQIRHVATPSTSRSFPPAPRFMSGPQSDAGRRACSACGEMLPRSSFSKRQWAFVSARRRCTACIVANRPSSSGVVTSARQAASDNDSDDSDPELVNIAGLSSAPGGASWHRQMFSTTGAPASDFDGQVSSTVVVSSSFKRSAPVKLAHPSGDGASSSSSSIPAAHTSAPSGRPKWFYDQYAQKWVKSL
ncbi:RING-5 protein [Thecamonas trahens ATCC 50062]|uniref:RBR-type E3 ubiquitin transferase n=1 Tax=Thecamonas trahens ATCC 50062 TaxID=461836 RepID=A0A0L0D6X2_THETB|nr:RING-5 protein [Thecamonas trahens ATCC 50062]KNC48079.1 RING-5 protein [Thecamonas trahens ATCC 50062]|eukprot:XP_013759094.1 RING-5 protein [Thecamonas trahens ATCC 50062]